MTAVQQLVSAPVQQRSAGGIGASEAAAAIGASDYATQFDAWLVATGRSPGFTGNEATEWGHILEPVIRARYVERHQVSVHVPPESLWHRDLPWLKATPDGIVLDASGAWSFIGPQVKNVGLRMAPAWDEGIPTDYLIQGVVEMAVCDLPRIDFAVLIGGQQYREITLERDAELEADVIEGLSAFWSLVETDTQPAIDESARLRSYLLKKLQRRTTLTASMADEAVIARWREVVVDLAKLKREERVIKNRVLSALVEAEAGKMTSSLGAISVGNPRKKTAWKAVAENGRAALLMLAKTRSELACVADILEPIAVTHIHGLIALIDVAVGDVPAWGALVEAKTTVGEPSINRPRGWTKDLDDSDGDDE